MSVSQLLQTHDLSIGYRQRRQSVVLASELQLRLCTGELVCLLGPNGAGKSTLLRTLAGLQEPLQGEIEVEGGERLTRWPAPRLARFRSMVLTDRLDHTGLTVEELLAFGRAPHTDWLGRLAAEDRQRIGHALETTRMTPLAHRTLHSLSDGERQKALIARALAQDTPLLMLDEPTAHLDLPARVEVMRLLRRLARTEDKAILLTTHELDLALQAADRVWLLASGTLHQGLPEALVLNGTFARVFATESVPFDPATGTFRLHTPTRGRMLLAGDPVGVFWTRRALERLGFDIRDSAAEAQPGSRIEVQRAGAPYTDTGFGWTFHHGGGAEAFSDLDSLLARLHPEAEQITEPPASPYSTPFSRR